MTPPWPARFQPVAKASHVLDKEIAAFDEMREHLLTRHMYKWVVFRDGELKGTYDTLDDAATFAVREFGRGPYLIRQVGEPEEMTLPASIRFRPVADAAG